jgi:hypothetical protein
MPTRGLASGVTCNAKKHTANMKLQIKILTTLILIFSATSVKADTWTDPSWKQMIEKSDLIVLAKVTNGDDFKSEFKVEKVYKGEIDTSFIWVTGYSNKYGPIDKKKNGEKYILFLTKKEFGQFNSMSNYKTEPQNSNFINYYKAQEKGNAYSVWTPTSGDLKVKGNKVQYDLLQTTYYRKQKYSSLKEFESFLNATLKSNEVFQQQLLTKLNKRPDNSQVPQYIMMLYLSNFRDYHPVFKKIANIGNSESCYAIAKILGQIKNQTSREILVELLDHENSVVQAEAVRELSNENADFIAPILLTKLKNAGEGGVYPQNIMNPVTNSVDGGKIEIIKTLGKLGYKPAIPELLPLLETDNKYVFETVMQVLIKLETKEYIPYLNKYLESCKRDFILDICYIIRDNNLTECIPSLMYFVANHDRTIHPSKEITISKWTGLAYFPTDTVKYFLYQDFLSVLKMKSSGSVSDYKMEWIEEYMDVFVKLNIDEAKPHLYDFMFDYYGINLDFKSDSLLFIEKTAKEDSIRSVLATKFRELDIKEIKCLAFIEKHENSTELTDYTVNICFNNPINFQEMFKFIEDKGLNINKISLTVGSYTQTHGAKVIRGFSDNLMQKFLEYLSSYPDELDITFMENLKRYDYVKSEYEIKQLDKFIVKAKKKLTE